MSQWRWQTLGGRRDGFTIFELILVLTILSLTVVVLMPLASKVLANLELETTGRDLITRMNQARSQAISRQKSLRVILKKGEREGDVDSYLLANEFEEAIGEFPLPEGLSLKVPDAGFPVRINFYPNGRSSGQKLVVRNTNGREIQILVDPFTGFARLIRDRD